MNFTTRIVPLPIENIDTDQIIPARYLKTTTRAGLGKSLFADWRYDSEGSPRSDFILNRPEMAGARILLAGDNFGCGSSREHAPWALTDYGFKAVISTSFADIFKNNALKNALLPIVVSPEEHARLLQITGEITIDLADQSITSPDGKTIHFPIDPFAKKCLLEGIDELGYLLKLEPQITLFEENSNRRDRRDFDV
jgi:3-isopropylmalate/(R)-2-methylmalate dehydratase small subunit